MHSLSQEIKGFSKIKLKKQCTRVTTLGGRRIIETSDGSTVEVTESGTGYGYVQDNSLDLQIGVIKPNLLLVENSFPDLFVYKTLNILDLPDTIITSYFEECSQFIDQAKAEKGVVLIHCNAGVSRSASVVIGYLMSRDRLSFVEAFASVKRARPAICPNPGFLEQLKNYNPQGDMETITYT
ncbi:hypothetical protein JZ751_027916 [Albula glossodonta]|uniref:Dual specificity protein phosphatase 19 n=1 Tax=Albula glossodonta TaxID=121402 RepID=A0A8T2PE55_9TELE|nr:hypothetical protein JZ751_027916 [Albula glossodonta]